MTVGGSVKSVTETMKSEETEDTLPLTTMDSSNVAFEMKSLEKHLEAVSIISSDLAYTR